jgi:hypothetical protein
MPIVSGYGGTLSFGGSTYTVKDVKIKTTRQSFDITQLSDFKEKRAPGRIRRSGTLTLYVDTAQSALRTHLVPTTLANALAASVTLVFTDSATNATTMNIHVTDAEESHDGTGAAMWTLSFEEQ